MNISWIKNDEASYLDTTVGGIRYHTIVERIPGTNDWDWTVWQRESPDGPARHGVADSMDSAKQQAETVIREWAGTQT